MIISYSNIDNNINNICIFNVKLKVQLLNFKV